MIRPEVIQETLAALTALGHKPTEARKLIDTAIQRGVEANSAAELLAAVYAKPAATKSQPKAVQSRNALAYYAYHSGSTATGDDAELVRIARAVGPGLTTQEFDALADRLNEVRGNRGKLTNKQYQEAIWAIPDAFAAGRSNPVHFQPVRDEEGRPLETAIPPIPAGAIDSMAPGVTAPPLTAETIGAAIGASAQPSDSAAAITGMLNAEPTQPPSPTTSTLDKVQAAADAIGVIDQTGITDLANAGVSLTRAFTEPGRAGHHLVNAGVSAVSAIPVVGDLAKLVKYGRGGAKAAGEGAKLGGAFDVHHSLTGAGGQGASSITNGGAFDIHHMLSGAAGGGQGHHTLPPGSSPANPIDLSPFATGGTAGTDGINSEGVQQAARDIGMFGESIDGLLERLGGGAAAVAAVGEQVYTRALKPLIDWFRAVDESSRKMLEENRQFAQFNGQVAAAYQQLDVGRFLRQQENAGSMAGSLGRLSGAQNRYEEAQQDLLQPYTRLSADIQAARTELAAFFLKLINSVDGIGGIIDWWYNQEKSTSAHARNDAERAAQMLDNELAPRKVGMDPAAINAKARAKFDGAPNFRKAW